MPKFTALIQTQGLRYITQLPLYSEIYSSDLEEPVRRLKKPSKTEPVLFDFEKAIVALREARVNEILSSIDKKVKREQSKEKPVEVIIPTGGCKPKQEKPKSKKKNSIPKKKPEKYFVDIRSDADHRGYVAGLLSYELNVSEIAAAIMLNSQPVSVSFDSPSDAIFFAKIVLAMGGLPEMRNE